MQKTNNIPEENQDQHQHQQDQTCPTCAIKLTSKMFRTGSVQHPGRDLLVCSRCGIRKDPRDR